MGAPAAQIEAGVRWQRPAGVFTDDPDVTEEYAELCARGELSLRSDSPGGPRPADTQARQQTILRAASLARRAAEDGYWAEASVLDSWGACVRVELVGPLTPELAADPEPGWRAEAAALYPVLCESGGVKWKAPFWSDTLPNLLAARSRDAVLEHELRALAARDGYQLEYEYDYEWHLHMLKLRAAGGDRQ